MIPIYEFCQDSLSYALVVRRFGKHKMADHLRIAQTASTAKVYKKKKTVK